MNPIVRKFVLPICAAFAVALPAAAQPPGGQNGGGTEALRAVLRFDRAQHEELAYLPASAVAVPAGDGRPFAYKLNRRRTTEAEAYDAVTLWNVRRVRVRKRRMRLSDSTGRERVCLLKFFTERDSRKGARPHLLGNVAGYSWASVIRVGDRWEEVRSHIAHYTLRHEVDSLRSIGAVDVRGEVPESFRHALSRHVPYLLDGFEVPSEIFQFIDGLILRTLQVEEDGAGGLRVVGDTYPGRSPLVVLGGERSTVAAWLEMCRGGLFDPKAEVPLLYYYMVPVEAVQLYGEAGRYGAIRIDAAE